MSRQCSIPARSVRILTIFAVVLLLSGREAATAADLSGAVVDDAALPIAGVMVTAAHVTSEFGGVAFTAPDGTFLISDLWPGDYWIVYSKTGLRPKQMQVTLPEEGFDVATATMKTGLGFGTGDLKRPRNYSVVHLNYATDRARVENAEWGFDYSAVRADTLEYGVARVAIPRDHRLGGFESPRLWRLEFRPDPNKHVALLEVRPEGRAQFAERLTGSETAVIFVHGFNVSFEDAARRAAQLYYDLKFNGTPILYSWPSNDAIGEYVADQDNAKLSASRFAEFVTTVSNLADDMHVIAHSMGNQVVTRGLELLSFGNEAQKPIIDELALVAPDVDADLFTNSAPLILPWGERTTLYVSSNDKALVAAKKLRSGYPRLGDIDAVFGPVVLPGVDTVDVSLLETGFLGHSYYGDNRSVIADLFHLLTTRRGPDDRFGLVPVALGSKSFWRFSP